MWRSATSRRTSFDASSSAWPGAMSALKLIENCRFVARDAASVRSRDSSLAMLSMRTGWPVDGRDRQLADRLDVAPLALEHADLHRVLLAGLAVGRDLVVARHHQAQRVADRRHADAEIGGARAIDRDLHLRAGVAVVGSRVDEARRAASPSRAAAASSRTACRCRARAGSPGSTSRRRRAAAAERIARLRRSGCAPGCFARIRRTRAITWSCVTFRSSVRQQIEEHVEVRVAVGAGQVGDVAPRLPDRSISLTMLLRDLGRALERGALRRVDVHRELAHVLVRARTCGRPSGSAETSARTPATEMPMIAHRVRQRPPQRARRSRARPQRKKPCSFVFLSRSASATFRNRELSIGVSVKLTSIDTRIANAIVQPNG